jgi:hypothetical protein
MEPVIEAAQEEVIDIPDDNPIAVNDEAAFAE